LTRRRAIVCQPAGSGLAGNQGFALVLVIWGLGLIGLIALTVITAERFRIQAAANVIENAKAEALAEAGINLIRLELASAATAGSPQQLRFSPGGVPVWCVMPGGALAALAVEDEGGKIDLNTASTKAVSAMLRGFGAEFDEADRLASAIAEFARPPANAVLNDAIRASYAQAGRAYGPKTAPFETVFELDQVIGMRTDLLRAVLPYVTVHSRTPGIDPRVARSALLTALAGGMAATVREFAPGDEPRGDAVHGAPAAFLSPSTNRSYLLHAEIRLRGGATFTQQAIVELSGGDPPDALREWRRGSSRFGTRLDDAARSGGGKSWPRCGSIASQHQSIR
jgi:general secretion pathway protein K